MDHGRTSDYLRIFDGNAYERKYQIEQLNGVALPANVSSLGPQMYIVFDADFGSEDYINYRGFKAKIVHEQIKQNNRTICTVANPCDIHKGHCQYDGQCADSLKCGTNNDCPQSSGYDVSTNCCHDHCAQFLTMENGTFGTLTYYWSHTYYPDMEDCSWPIKVAENQIINVQLEVIYV